MVALAVVMPIVANMAASMFVTFIFSGVLSAYISFVSKALKIDPMIVSSAVNVIGFSRFYSFP